MNYEKNLILPGGPGANPLSAILGGFTGEKGEYIANSRLRDWAPRRYYPISSGNESADLQLGKIRFIRLDGTYTEDRWCSGVFDTHTGKAIKCDRYNDGTPKRVPILIEKLPNVLSEETRQDASMWHSFVTIDGTHGAGTRAVRNLFDFLSVLRDINGAIKNERSWFQVLLFAHFPRVIPGRSQKATKQQFGNVHDADDLNVEDVHVFDPRPELFSDFYNRPKAQSRCRA